MKYLAFAAALLVASCTQGKAADSGGPVTLTNSCLQTGGTSKQVDTVLTCQMTALQRIFSAQGSCYVLTVGACAEVVTSGEARLGTDMTKITFIAGDGNTQDGKWFPHVGNFLNARQIQSKDIKIGLKGAVAQPEGADFYYYVDQANGQLTLE